MVAAAQMLTAEVTSTIVDVLKWRGQHEANRCAFSFMNRGNIEDLTYGELDQRARRIAGCLLERGLEGERALLSLPTGISLLAGLFGCMYAGTTAVPVCPPRSPEDAIRVAGIIDDAGARAVLTVRAALDVATAVNLAAARVADLSWIALDDEPTSSRAVHSLSPRRMKAPAILQYTSGSTAKPRGVINAHDNLMANLEAMRHAFGNDPRKSRVVSWLPSYHDMGLIGGILESLYVGMPALLLSSVSFIKRPISWLEAIRDYRATTSGGPNFAFDLCVRRTTEEQRAALDLSTWEVAFCGAEPIRSESLDAFAEAFAGSGFRREAFFPCYGLAEATLMVTGVPRLTGSRAIAFASEPLKRGEAVPPVDAEPSTALVACGKPVEGTRITIVDPSTLREKRAGEIGEIWVTGRGVAAGYWGKPEETEQVFGAKRRDDPRASHLRTGDLGFIRGGELFVTGRCKDLIIVRGANHYPQDIEASVQACSPELRAGRGVAFSVTNESGEQLVIVQEVETSPRELRQLPERCQSLLQSIVEVVSNRHGLRPCSVVLVARGTISLTSSGKLQRQATRMSYVKSELDPIGIWIDEDPSSAAERSDAENAVASGAVNDVPPETAPMIEEWLCHKLAKILGAKRQSIDPHRTFGQLGVDSVVAMEALLELENAYGLVLEPAHFYDHPSPRALAAWIAQMIGKAGAGRAPEASGPTKKPEGAHRAAAS